MQNSPDIRNTLRRFASSLLKDELTDLKGQLAAISKSQSVIEFTLDGRIIKANDNFLNLVGYSAEEIIGKHHSLLTDPEYSQSDEYKIFWEKLGRGEFDQGQYKRVGKNSKEVWIEASYNPIYDLKGKPYKVLKYATDITQQKLQAADYQAQIAAISKSQGVIEFTLDGKVITANENFLKVLGYTIDEVIGQHHRRFVDAEYRNSIEYEQFWEKLGRGEFHQGQYKRIGKGEKEVWIEASYNPIFDFNGKPFKVVKYATDITEQKLRESDYSGQLAAISKSQGVIEFTLDGKVITANKNFLNMLGYTLEEAVGQHHSKFVDAVYRESLQYKEFWQKLGRGEFDQGQYKRIGKGEKEVWIEASYNPIFDLNGKPFKVVKYATDITEQKLKAADHQGQIDAIGKSQGVIEFTLDGKVITANENFLNILGYTLDEAVGQRHSAFVEPSYRNSPDYSQFWDKLSHGQFDQGQYKRIGKAGKEIWIQASYNPIFDLNGKPFKVVKYATDITDQVNASNALKAAVAQTKAVVEAAKSGNLTERVSMDGKKDEIAALCEGVNALIENISSIIIEIQEAGETINTAAGEISTGNNDLSQRTEEQASSLEETASSMEQLASTVKQNAANANQANQLAAKASSVAVRGGDVVNLVVSTMSDINASSRKIEDIISVIDGIAFQTNILALNAAVEAARAGEQGRGFAVVAAEVRNLAQRSAAAAKEIKQLISDSVEKVQAGTKQVEEAGTTMEAIVASVKRVTDIMGEIASASVQQSSGIDQVNVAITQMDEVTQQNAALVEQAAAAAESLVEQADNMMQSVSRFKTSHRESKPKLGNILVSQPPVFKMVSKPVAKPALRIAEVATTESDWAEF